MTRTSRLYFDGDLDHDEDTGILQKILPFCNISN